MVGSNTTNIYQSKHHTDTQPKLPLDIMRICILTPSHMSGGIGLLGVRTCSDSLQSCDTLAAAARYEDLYEVEQRVPAQLVLVLFIICIF